MEKYFTGSTGLALSHAALAVLSLVLFLAVVFAASFAALHTVEQASSTPVLSVSAEAYVDPKTMETLLVLTARLERGKPVVFEKLELYTPTGVLVWSASEFSVEGCVSTAITYPGSTCKFTLLVPGNLLQPYKTYSGVAYFSEGAYAVSVTPVFKAVKPGSKSLDYNTSFTSVSIEQVVVENLLKNLTMWKSEGAGISNTSEGVVVVDLNSTSFGGVGFAYYNLNVEANTTAGVWLVVLLRLNNVTALPAKFGAGVFFDFKNETTQPQEKVVFAGISIESTGPYLTIEVYDRTSGTVDTAARQPISSDYASVVRNETVLLALYIKSDKNKNFYNISATLYDLNLNTIATASVVNYEIKLPGTPGEWSHKVALVVSNASATFEFAALAKEFTTPFIKVSGVPRDYIVEVYSSNGTLLYRVVSGGGIIELPFTYLDAGTVILVKYPKATGELLAYYYVLDKQADPGTVFEFSASTVSSVLNYGGSILVVSTALSVGSNYTNISGVVLLNLTNTNGLPAKVKLTLIPELSSLGNLTLEVALYNTSGVRATEGLIIVREGSVVSNTTGWTTTFVKPGEVLQLYAKGYSPAKGGSYKLTLYLEAYCEDEQTGLVLSVPPVYIVVNITS